MDTDMGVKQKMTEKTLIQEVQENKKTILELNNALDELEESEQKKENEFLDEINDKIEELEKKKREIRSKFAAKITEIKKEHTLKKEELSKPIIKLDRIFKFFDVLKSEFSVKNPEVYDWNYPKDDKGEIIRINEGRDYPEKEKQYYSPIAILRQNSFINLKVYIVHNDNYRKKVNHFSLVVVGYSKLGGLIELPYSYGIDCRTDDSNIQTTLKEAPDKNTLYNWYVKNQDRVFKDFLEAHRKIEEEYSEIVKLYDDKEYKLAYWESKKYYWEHSVHNGVDEPEYKQVLKTLEYVKNGR